MDSTLITQIVQQVAEQHPGGVRGLNDLLVIVGWAVVFLLWHYRWKLLAFIGQHKKNDETAITAVLPAMQSDLVEIKTGVKDLRENVAVEREYTRKAIKELYETSDEHGGKLERLDERTKRL